MDGGVVTQGDYAMAGISGSYAPLQVDFLRPGGGDNSAVLPTGRPTDIIDVSQLGQIEVSLIDAGNATVFVQAKTLGLQGTELPDQLFANQGLMQNIESIRCHAAVLMGKSESLEAAHKQPATPKLAIVSTARSYADSQGKIVKEKDIDLCSRIFSMGQPHHAYTGTGAIALAVAARIPDTVVRRNTQHRQKVLKFGHAAGMMECHAEVELVNDVWIALAAGITRTARVLMRGEVFVPITHVLDES
jgi:2-methylaconitate cis-trans-isomerase PrpF